jgi:cobyrinic acid a,c-diamide synthase
MAHPGARMLLVAAVASGQGKTTVTAALARGLVPGPAGARVQVRSDFIDPMLLERASGAPVHTLDLWMVGREAVPAAAGASGANADVILIEGVMGLYDGTHPSADLSRAFGVPVMAVIDASSMAQTAGAVVHGLRDYGPVRWPVSSPTASPAKATRQMVAASLRDIPLLATLPRQAAAAGAASRPGAAGRGRRHRRHPRRPGRPAAPVRRGLAQPAPRCASRSSMPRPRAACSQGRRWRSRATPLSCFLYPANLDTLRQLGARWHSSRRWPTSRYLSKRDAVYLPGGYPELHPGAVAGGAWQARSARPCRRHADRRRMRRHDGAGRIAGRQSGAVWPMAGLLPGAVSMHAARLAGLGSQGLPTAARRPARPHLPLLALETALAPATHTVKHPSGAQGEACVPRRLADGFVLPRLLPIQPRGGCRLFSRSEP